MDTMHTADDIQDKKYIQDFDEFIKKNPEINPEWRPKIAPEIEDADLRLFNFVMRYLFM